MWAASALLAERRYVFDWIKCHLDKTVVRHLVHTFVCCSTLWLLGHLMVSLFTQTLTVREFNRLPPPPSHAPLRTHTHTPSPSLQIVIPPSLGQNDRTLTANSGSVRVRNALLGPDPTALLQPNLPLVPGELRVADPGVVMERFVVTVSGLQAMFTEASGATSTQILQVQPSSLLQVVMTQPLNVAEKAVSSVHTRVRANHFFVTPFGWAPRVSS